MTSMFSIIVTLWQCIVDGAQGLSVLPRYIQLYMVAPYTDLEHACWKKGDFFSWSPPYFVKWREVLLSPVKMFQCSKLPCLGWRSADFLQGFFRPKCLQEQLKHARTSTTISMGSTNVEFGDALCIVFPAAARSTTDWVDPSFWRWLPGTGCSRPRRSSPASYNANITS
jgi:hypothetical protein